MLTVHLSRIVCQAAMPASVDEDHIIVVGGMDGDQLWSNSAYGGSVLDICAPVHNVTTGAMWDTTGYSTFTGTSSATPHVTGAAALLLEKQKKSLQNQNVPDYLAVEDYIQLMAESARMGVAKTYGAPLQKRNDLGYGVLNVNDAMALLTLPNKLEHLEVDFSAEPPDSTLINDVTVSSSEHLYDKSPDYVGPVKRYEFTETVSFGKAINDILRVWVRGAVTRGFPNIRQIVLQPPPTPTPPFNAPLFSDCGWAEVLSFTNSTATIRTYLYEIKVNNKWEWLNNITPDSMSVAFSILSGPGVTAVEDNQEIEKKMELQVYPTILTNSHQVAVVSARLGEVGDLSVYDVYGRRITSFACLSGNSTINIDRTRLLNNGVYFIVLSSESGIAVKKIILL